jgi:hypothetical protein
MPLIRCCGFGAIATGPPGAEADDGSYAALLPQPGSENAANKTNVPIHSTTENFLFMLLTS